jgi:hypothetical protein
MKIFVLFLSFLLALAASASESEVIFSPATIPDSPMSIGNIIKFPKSMLRTKVEKNIVVRCDASISNIGRFISNICLNDSSKEIFPYSSAINYAAKNAVIKPAKINGKGHKVWFQYFVVFSKKGSNGIVEVFPNSGLEIEKYGPDYTSAQRFEEDSENFGASCGSGFSNTITVNAIIGKDGIPKNVTVKSENSSEKCKKNMESSFLKQRYIPAFYNSVAVDSFYSEEITNYLRE